VLALVARLLQLALKFGRVLVRRLQALRPLLVAHFDVALHIVGLALKVGCTRLVASSCALALQPLAAALVCVN